MNFNQISRQSPILDNLFRQSQYWRQLTQKLQAQLPSNLYPYFQVACIREGCLVVLSRNNMAASRLRMLLPALLPLIQTWDESIQSIQVKIQLQPETKAAQKKLKLNQSVQNSFTETAARLAHHPELAEALRHLGKKDL
ncbi:DciA family protein [Stenoxybacter acetivorans]|uniref:DciA family protein n=1 Tax=Stenoxybacter acetivorans TaxID=422441 RepID=UPI000569EF87|nr:DciA family protein [Stenoxybacter acetivorans]